MDKSAGRVGGSRLMCHPWIDIAVDELNDAWRHGLEQSIDWQAFNRKVQQELEAGKGKVFKDGQMLLRDLKRRIRP